MMLLADLNARIPVAIVSHDISLLSTHLKRVAVVGRSIEVRPAATLPPEGLEAHSTTLHSSSNGEDLEPRS